MHVPKLVVFDKNGKVVTEDGVRDIYKHKNGIFEYWNKFLN